ncbi:MAG TPA: Ig-like domain-containing protein, partial [Candidatus Limiplasma sp.]|nr:Ig-like domain-containing protein [Candidatus Limiplasma sp.]
MKKWLALILCLVLLSGSIAFAAETPVTVTYAYGDIVLAAGTATSVRVNVTPYVAKKKGVTYATSDESIATVTSKGRLTGVAEGDCQLIVTSVYDTTVSATIPVHIVIPVDTLTLSAPENTVSVGETLQLSVAYSPENATQKSAAFSSANSSVASVSPTGLVTGLKRGTAVITAVSSDGEAKATLKVTVSQPVQSVTVTPADGKAAVGRKIQLKASVSPSNANNQAVEWASDNESVAVVSSKGAVTVKGVGSATITATSSDNAAISGSVTVQGVQLAQSVAFDTSLYAVIINQTGQVHVNVLPESTSDKSVTYKVGNSRIATVDKDGVITALKGGK